MSVREYTVIFERADDGGWGAYVPDLPGLGVVGETLEEAETLIRDGIVLHISGLVEDGLPVPPPVTRSTVVRVTA
jgi:predicted RNase H-like HicB family nuclease